MEKVNVESLSGQTLFVGIDAHKKTFHVTLRTFDCEIIIVGKSKNTRDHSS